MTEYVYPSGQSGVRLETTDSPNRTLSDSEIEVICEVCNLFGGLSAGEISEISHREKGWIDNIGNRSPISYQDAFALKYG